MLLHSLFLLSDFFMSLLQFADGAMKCLHSSYIHRPHQTVETSSGHEST